MDVVIPLGSGSTYNNAELRYALRSIEKNVIDLERVFIIGEKPEFLCNVIHIPQTDNNRRGEKERNICMKILKVCKSDVSEDFLFTNDDIFLTRQITAAAYPYYYSGELLTVARQRRDNDPYKISVRNTIDVLQSNGLPVKYFDIHCPIRYNKIAFTEAMKQFHWSRNGGYVIKSLYSNYLGIEGEIMGDLKINAPQNSKGVKNLISGRHVFSISDRGWNLPLKRYLEELYPEPSRYEQPC